MEAGDGVLHRNDGIFEPCLLRRRFCLFEVFLYTGCDGTTATGTDCQPGSEAIYMVAIDSNFKSRGYLLQG